mmetsp:Transcript_123680/g.350244  ORF Transcript_123680/g.350244 Transcript_123680/m.350244 type:complete len:205 (+) Transcript_123680:1191-1805(+)
MEALGGAGQPKRLGSIVGLRKSQRPYRRLLGLAVLLQLRLRVGEQQHAPPALPHGLAESVPELGTGGVHAVRLRQAHADLQLLDVADHSAGPLAVRHDRAHRGRPGAHYTDVLPAAEGLLQPGVERQVGRGGPRHRETRGLLVLPGREQRLCQETEGQGPGLPLDGGGGGGGCCCFCFGGHGEYNGVLLICELTPHQLALEPQT